MVGWSKPPATNWPRRPMPRASGSRRPAEGDSMSLPRQGDMKNEHVSRRLLSRTRLRSMFPARQRPKIWPGREERRYETEYR